MPISLSPSALQLCVPEGALTGQGRALCSAPPWPPGLGCFWDLHRKARLRPKRLLLQLLSRPMCPGGQAWAEGCLPGTRLRARPACSALSGGSRERWETESLSRKDGDPHTRACPRDSVDIHPPPARGKGRAPGTFLEALRAQEQSMRLQGCDGSPTRTWGLRRPPCTQALGVRESALQGRARLRRKASGQGMAFELDLQGSGRWTCGDEGEETTAAGDTQEPAWLERRVVGRLVVLGASRTSAVAAVGRAPQGSSWKSLEAIHRRPSIRRHRTQQWVWQLCEVGVFDGPPARGWGHGSLSFAET